MSPLVALFTAIGAKLIFSPSRGGPAWRRMLPFAAVPTVVAAFAGLIFTGRDGAMLTYVAMVLAAALGCWLASLQIWRT
ncbi:MAG: hypothetical protein ABI564_02660 [Ideonella sp.]